MAKCVSNGLQRLRLETPTYSAEIKVNEEFKDFLKRNATRIQFDSNSGRWMYKSKKGQKTTLARRLYASYKACKPLDEISGKVNFKNGKTNDLRLENLTTRKVN